MNEHYKFFSNSACEYFPCHKTEHPEQFNCLFCFCPLYMLGEHCGGNFKRSGNVKDCSDCMIPHGPNAYAYVMSKMGEVIKIGSRRDEQEG